ncbi:MAG: PIN domain-containing protein [Frankiaceae bacterium]|nr:PIN domain-containing protein [Frankiaceae bacterium]MBV9872516.1 PIN domain-containing protein [Frankiaceae bacterium]
MDAFDSDVLIFAARPRHDAGARVAGLFRATVDETGGAGIGSVVLIPEVLTKPFRDGDAAEYRALDTLLGWLDLRPVTSQIASLAARVGAEYGLKPLDAVHLATALEAGADRFITNNRRDFSKSIEGIEVTFPDDLAAPA